MANNTYEDSYGLTQKLGAYGEDKYNQSRLFNSGGAVRELIVPLKIVNGVLNPDYNKDANNDGTRDSFGGDLIALPVCVIKSATVVVTTAFDGIVAQTVDIGLFKANGTAIDADGLCVDLAAANLGATGVTAGAGALIGKKVTEESFVKATPSASITGAGEGYIVVEYYV